MRPLAIVMLTLFASTLLSADLKRARTYSTHEPKDAGVLFRAVVTPEQDILIWIAKGDGLWRLTRIRRWLAEKPGEETISVPGVVVPKESPNDKEFLATLDLDLSLGSDSLLNTKADGLWMVFNRRGGRHEIVESQVDLQAFRVIQTKRETSPISPDVPSGPPKVVPARNKSSCEVLDLAVTGDQLELCGAESLRVRSASGLVLGTLQ